MLEMVSSGCVSKCKCCVLLPSFFSSFFAITSFENGHIYIEEEKEKLKCNLVLFVQVFFVVAAAVQLLGLAGSGVGQTICCVNEYLEQWATGLVAALRLADVFSVVAPVVANDSGTMGIISEVVVVVVASAVTCRITAVVVVVVVVRRAPLVDAALALALVRAAVLVVVVVVGAAEVPFLLFSVFILCARVSAVHESEAQL